MLRSTLAPIRVLPQYTPPTGYTGTTALDAFSPGSLLLILALLIAVSAFFSASETSLMALNRYRLRHLINKNHRGAKRTSQLLAQTDRLLGILLLGNTLVNILASSLATLLAYQLYGDTGVAIATFLLVFVLLLFAEVIPKTVAALHPETVAFPASFVLLPLMKAAYPILWMVNGLSNSILRLIGVNPRKVREDQLTADELRTVVRESGTLISPRYRSMLLNILDLDGMTVEDIMVPRTEITGLDLTRNLDDLLADIGNGEFTRLPVFNDDINNVIGILHVKKILHLMQHGQTPDSKACITDNMEETYFVPISTPLNMQLLNFQKLKQRMAIVVDEYGDVQGLVTLEDLLEEIVGEFTTNIDADMADVFPQADGSVVIDCSASIRDINRHLQWQLPVDGPKTLNGLITDHLGTIPDNNVCFVIRDYCFETVEIDDNRIVSVRGFERNKTRSLFH